MNISFPYNHIIATILIIMYLALPTTIFAHVASMEVGDASLQATTSSSSIAPCDNCPCSDGHGSECCDSTICNCACHAPLGQGLRLTYAPVIATQSFLEPSWSFPQVYRTIFVPPQNLV